MHEEVLITFFFRIAFGECYYFSLEIVLQILGFWTLNYVWDKLEIWDINVYMI